MYPLSFYLLITLLVVNIVTNKLIKIIGKEESATRFLHIALYQGKTKVPFLLQQIVTKNREVLPLKIFKPMLNTIQLSFALL